MSFEILYVEDEVKEWRLLKKAVTERNKNIKGRKLVLKWVQDPVDLKKELSLSTDLVLTDMVFPDEGGEREKLGDVILAVQAWTKDHQYGSPLPIIAFTGRGEKALELCLRRKDALYDIWDKSSASLEYVAWRLSDISKELTRNHPDALSQRLIREMPQKPRASWHDCVVKMTRGYDAGWSEHDQIRRAGESIGEIALKLDVWTQCEPLWDTMVKWEPLSRAIDPKTRGHARHVINVFWLGYYLLHHKHLNKMFSEYWGPLVHSRRNTGPVANAEPLEALSNCWFFAAIFHDVGGCVEKSSQVSEYQNKLMSVFRDLAPPSLKLQHKSADEFMIRAKAWLSEFEDPLLSLIERTVRDSAGDGKPDQGVVGALYLREMIDNPQSKWYAIEGGRAMSLHNIFPKLQPSASTLPITWAKEPLVCLLLLCDQLQTWDREPGTDSFKDTDMPARAELTDLNIGLEAGRPRISMSIDYIARKHLGDSPEAYERTKSELKNILLKNPYSALHRIQKPWPFTLIVKCTLNGDPLPEMKFGSD